MNQTSESNGRSALRVLAIAEDAAVAGAIRDALRASGPLGIDLKFESEGWEALRRLAEGSFDLAVVDSRGPVEEDALKLIALARDQRIYVPLVLLVEQRDGDFVGRARDAGAADTFTIAEVRSAAFSHLLRCVTETHRISANGRAEGAAYRRRIEELGRELTAAREELKNSQASVEAERLTAIEQLVVTVRHEVNNPLAILMGRAQLLRTRSRNVPDAVRQALEEIEEQAMRIRTIMDKLDLARDGRTTGYLDGRRIKLD